MFKVHVQLYIHKKMVMASVFFFLTDYLFSKRQKKNKDTNDTHTSIMHTYKINRRKD